MGTRAILGSTSNIKNEIDEIILESFITLSYDGYPDNVLEKFKSHYNQLGEIMFSGGNMQSIGKSYFPNPLGFHSVDYPQKNVSVVYLRDKNVENPNECLAKFNIKLKDVIDTHKFYDYIYLIDKETKDIYYSSLVEEFILKKYEV
jgi:hypothetical protein